MHTPRFKRRKEDRPAEITEAALHAFAENGYDATRVDDVAKRAGAGKGLLYLVFQNQRGAVQCAGWYERGSRRLTSFGKQRETPGVNPPLRWANGPVQKICSGFLRLMIPINRHHR